MQKKLAYGALTTRQLLRDAIRSAIEANVKPDVPTARITRSVDTIEAAILDRFIEVPEILRT